MRTDKSRKRFVFLCVAPATILFFLFMILPTLNVFRMSLYERGAYSPNETFVGLKNFQHLLRDAQFIRSMQNMILLVVTVTLITFAFALVFAAILTREKIKGQNFFHIIFYIPNILSVVVISGIFSAIYKPENGMLNSIIGLFRNMSDPILWKGEKLVIPSIIIAMVWQAIGYYMVMYMASMSAVPISLYESANLDGAGRLTQFFQITIPLIRAFEACRMKLKGRGDRHEPVPSAFIARRSRVLPQSRFCCVTSTRTAPSSPSLGGHWTKAITSGRCLSQRRTMSRRTPWPLLP